MIRDCFVRAFDDAIVLKGLNWGRGSFHEQPVRNVRVHGNVIWCDLGVARSKSGPRPRRPRSPRFGSRTATSSARRILRWTSSAVTGRWCTTFGMRMSGRDRRRLSGSADAGQPGGADREDPAGAHVPNVFVIVIGKNPYSKDAERGNVRRCGLLVNVSVASKRVPRSFFNGLDGGGHG